MHPDGAREVRAGVLLLMPVPPMPLMVSRRLEDEHGTTSQDHSFQPSHDLLAHLLNVAASHGKQSHHDARILAQKRAEDELFAAIDALQDAPVDVEQVWHAFCAYKRAYIASFTLRDGGDARFGDPGSVPQGCRVWDTAYEHARAHDVFFGPDPRVGGTVEPGCAASYADFVVRAARRIWWAGKDAEAEPAKAACVELLGEEVD